ncbi:MAG: hypothetical protein HYR56_27985, partial [Acidobacteria bacterium]|nr:hypothetical protein [Acidobacteriota bacterium]
MSFLKDLVERFKRHLYSAAVFAFLLILLFVSDLLQVSATFQHILLTLTAVMFIHLLDRLYLIKDTNEALDKLFGAVRTDTKAQTDSLNQKSQELLETSKKLINEQTDSLTQKSQQLLESSSELISSVRTGITAQMDQLIGGVRTDIKGQTDSLIHTSKSLEAMDRCGLIRVYPTRIEASEDMRKDITNPANSKMMLIGISLNDFVQGIDHTLREAWETIQAYILGTKRIDDPKQGLDIRILIIDPKCLGAKLRSKAESESVSALAFRLETDVRAAAEALHRLEAEAAKNSSTTGVKFECRLYRLPPIMFLCWIDSICYAQQYHFWSKRDNRTPIPVFKYRRLDASAYPYHKEMENHFEWIWKNASIKVSDYLETEVVGTDEG